MERYRRERGGALLRAGRGFDRLKQGLRTLVLRHWLAWANTAWGGLVILPWLAPVLMKVGATRPARGIYLAYGFLCHQFADRSIFLFGPRPAYSYTELLPYAPRADTWLGLRAFVGTPELGYKVAWSDRMISLYGGLWIGGLLFALVRRRIGPLRWPGFALLAIPMALDGGTHLISDLAGIGQGFRYENAWLAQLTGNLFPSSFYGGTNWGSFNSWARLVTGLLFGLALVWFLYPHMDQVFHDLATCGRPAPAQAVAGCTPIGEGHARHSAGKE